MNLTSSSKRASLFLGPTEHQGIAKRPAVKAAARDRALAALKLTYGFDAFRGKQEEAVLAALSGRDVLVIMPTGGGKTICYVIPALVQPGLCIVVSPLLALMQDQVANLNKVGVRAAQLSSALTASERAAVMADLFGAGGIGVRGQPSIRLLLVTPELLVASKRFRSLLHRLHAQRNLSLFAIDESHCISTWGHDFRPAYRKLQELRRDFPGVPIMALTATAASKVREDICEQLQLHNPVILLSSFNRPNISYTVRYLDAEKQNELEALVRLLSGRRTAGGAVPCSIVYCQKRDTCEGVSKHLSSAGVPALAYHGQMKKAEKTEVLRRWQADEVPVVVATIAFGMGIDKAGVRLVVHFNLPRNLEGFYQEAGRAGRDGQPADSILFYRLEARMRMDFILKMDLEKERKVEEDRRAGVKGQSTGRGRRRRGAGWGIHDDDVIDAAGAAAEAAEEEENVEDEGGYKCSGSSYVDADGSGDENVAMTPTAEEEAQLKNTAWQSFGQVVDWVLAAGCRRKALLEHFGETCPRGPCGSTGDGYTAGCDCCRDPQHVQEQLELLKRLELEAVAKRQGCRGGKRDDDDDEADMFAVRGGGGSGSGSGRDNTDNGDRGGAAAAADEAGPGVYYARRRDPQECKAHMDEARSAAAAARAVAGGRVNDEYFAALAAREREHERRVREAGGDVVDRMLAAASGSGGGGGVGVSGGAGGTSPPAAPLDASTRAIATSKLAAALAASQAGSGVDPSLLQRLAAAVEADVYGNGLPRQQYTSRMAGLISRVKASVSLLVLRPQQQGVICATNLLPVILQAELSAIESLICQLETQVSHETAAPPGTSGVGGGGGGVGGNPASRAAARLMALADVSVTTEAVAAGNVGRRINKLGKYGFREVAEAARQVVASWKRQLPEVRNPGTRSGQ